ncbi:MAG: holo-ACP synthase [Phycisphaerales bacterium]
MTPLALGTDLVEVQRIAGLLRRHGERFRARCFTPRERADSERSGDGRAPERYAARFAAKEAVAKALGTGVSGGIAWTDIEVELGEKGEPSIRLHEHAARRAHELGIRAWLCSITHTESLASATAIGLG